MSEIFAVRNLDKRTREAIRAYAYEHNLSMAEAIREMVSLVQEHIKKCLHGGHKKKYRSFFEVYDKIKFSGGDPNLSKNIDKVLYGKR